MPLDVVVVASANPEDYTNRGRIITPLKDRYGAQIRTHYPQTVEEEMRIMDAEAADLPLGDYRVSVPEHIKEIIAEVTHLCRQSPDVSQRSGVSVRASISNFEVVRANALRRAVRLGEYDVVPRPSDLPWLLDSLQGKVEFETIEEGREHEVLDRILSRATLNVFNRRVSSAQLEALAGGVADDLRIEVGESMPSDGYGAVLTQFPALAAEVTRLVTMDNAAARASAVEFLLEGMHLHKLLNRDELGGSTRYRS